MAMDQAAEKRAEFTAEIKRLRAEIKNEKRAEWIPGLQSQLDAEIFYAKQWGTIDEDGNYLTIYIWNGLKRIEKKA
jgi:CRISPR/Cas system-associated exonuclease Cas4 (RecB family)